MSLRGAMRGDGEVDALRSRVQAAEDLPSQLQVACQQRRWHSLMRRQRRKRRQRNGRWWLLPLLLLLK